MAAARADGSGFPTLVRLAVALQHGLRWRCDSRGLPTIIASYRSHESGMRHNRGIYEKLAECLPEGKRARDVLSAQELGALLKDVK